ncbi:hypothetical protein [Tepidibacter hydrothermalis]|uniref:Uncharacterized protein n=1 Tax=Tepidibacter hydrothermalis TaxID=3036126 RepID=A0ABY8EEN3_9FIRM|nr:hypothetical protein [Tepidibacter hydrothermalis]WFD11408.1 hypothetical protein P4S50_04845 [Tepidibacter hydrothermalis]
MNENELKTDGQENSITSSSNKKKFTLKVNCIQKGKMIKANIPISRSSKSNK